MFVRTVLWLWLGLIWTHTARGQTHGMLLEYDHESQPIAEVEVFPPMPGSDSEILQKLPHSAFTSVKYGQKIGDTFQEIWFRITLRNLSAMEQQDIIYLPSRFAAKSYDFYVFSNGVFLSHSSYRGDRKIMDAEIIGRSSYSPVTLAPHALTEVYVKVDSGYESLTHNFQISTRQHFINWEVFSTFFVGIFLGILFLTAITNFMQAAAYRDRIFLWHSIFCSAMLLSSMSFFGLWRWLLGFREWQQYLSYFGSNLSIIAGVIFSRAVLDTPKIAPKMDFVLRTVRATSVLCFFLRFPHETTNFAWIVQNYNAMIFTLSVMIAGTIGIIKRKELAVLFTVSFFFFSISVVYLRLSLMNVIAVDPLAFYAPALGQIFQITLISYVMFLRGRNAYREMLNSRRNKTLNQKLNLLLKIISHDIANPLQAISLYTSMALEQAKKGLAPVRELEKSLEAVRIQSHIIQHAKEAVRQMQLGQSLKIKPILVSTELNDLQHLFEPLCQHQGIRLWIVNDLPHDVILHSDSTVLVHSIFGNILSNSIKFTPEGGTIRIHVSMQHKRVLFDLVDSGPGITKDKRIEIFTLNVRGGQGLDTLSGSGSFGLSILQMCADLLNGHLDVGPSEISDSGQEMGLRISVSLPLHHAL